MLSIPKQMGIPIVSKGTKRIYFKIDINCKEGLMHEYGISGMFMAYGMKHHVIKEKLFQYSCKVGEFKDIFESSPEEASDYAKKKLSGYYSTNSINIFTNSFRKIHDLTKYCHSDKVIQDVLISKLQMLHADFVNVPEITGKRIIPLIQDEMDKLILVRNMASLNPSILNLCDKLVEYLHSEVMGAEVKRSPDYSVPAQNIPRKEPVYSGQKECTACGNVITESNKSLICMKCRSRFCLTCEEWFREERKRGDKPLCEKCFDEESQREESEKKKEKEQEWAKILRERERRAKEEIPKNFTSSIGMEFVLIPSGEFIMGSEEYEREKPVHKVKISKPFYLGIYPVTQQEWKKVLGSNLSYFKGDKLPVETVSWDDVQDFIKKLNQKEGANKYRLPTEAEWEYAARAGTTTSYSFGDDESKLVDYAHYSSYISSSFSYRGSKTNEVGQKKPNPWGLYDIHGSVWEWVQDKWYGNYNDAPIDGSSRESGDGSDRVIRGGSWQGDRRGLRSAIRQYLRKNVKNLIQ
ncbi:MAG: formylglycine-generating enzyme family protein [Candidatus Methanoperedenaceae archaeon]|nr:formylglycine-generating enzyme family protein [Candidatus Methanoperedenaceae archaeon]